MNNILIAYFIYVPVVILLTVYVSRTLFHNSLVFMMDIFNGREAIARSTNKLFEVGFYLINLGFALFFLTIYDSSMISMQEGIEILSVKLGGFTIYLGLMLFANLFLFFRGKRKAKENRLKTALKD
ncbi:MAG: hypothetical protein AAFY71_20610 [Bacteroidota bacterium]